ncbi:hypothetical protein B0H14DRAFT_2592546 [Mycena olivaceomarginata]|nr:hypothetical protein B0H14DRAFT_2592546 [Mycena olivaceomarginata]
MDAAGINTELAKDLENPITCIPPLDDGDNDGDEDIVEKASNDLQQLLEDEAPVALPAGSVVEGLVVDFGELERIDKGETAIMDEEAVEIVGGDVAGGWSIEDLMRS